MHVPKTAGTAFADALQSALAPVRSVSGLDRYLFGSFDEFGAFSEAARRTIFLTAASLPRDATFVSGHFACSTLRAAYPNGRFLTVLREPVTRLLSHWLYWRQFPDDALVGLAGWHTRVHKARLPLVDFLSDPQIASQTDNLMTRALLWPHALIPVDGFINPRHDRRLLRAARSRLRAFDFVDVVESEQIERRVGAWLQLGFSLTRINETTTMPQSLRTPLHRELTRAAHDRLDACSRLDLRLWSDTARRAVGRSAVPRLRERTVAAAMARYGRMM